MTLQFPLSMIKDIRKFVIMTFPAASNILVIIFIYLLNSPLSFAQKVKISGQSNYGGTLIRLIVQDDLISFHESTIAISMSDDEGRFSFEAPLDRVRNASIAFGIDRGELFIMPGKRYELFVSAREPEEPESFFEKEPLHIEVISTDDRGFMKQIHEINLVYNTFLLQYFNVLYRGIRHDLIDSLKTELSLRIVEPAHDYVNEYITYKLAALELASRNRSPQFIIENYFINKEVLYDNIEYMSLAKELYSGFLRTMRSVSQADLQQIINSGYQALDSLMKTDLQLRHDSRFRDLVTMLNLHDLFVSRLFEPASIERVLSYIAEKSLYSEHRAIAANLIKQSKILAFGTPAPLFKLDSSIGEPVDLRDLKDKPVVISFITKDCIICENAMLDLESIWQRYQDRYYFVTLSTADSFDEVSLFFDNNGLSWPLLNISQHILLLEHYQVRTFPEFVILLPGNAVGMIPAPGPDRHLEYHMNRLLSVE